MIKQIPSGALAAWRAPALRLFALLALATLLTGCDSCGDFWSPSPGQTCHGNAPKPR